MSDPSAFRMAIGQVYTPLKYRHGAEANLQGFSVASNSTSFLHSEQMLDMGGPIALAQAPNGEYQVTNRTDHTLRGVGLLKRNSDPQAVPKSLDVAWLGTLKPGATAAAQFEPVSATDLKTLWDAEREDSPQTMAQPPDGEVSLRGCSRWPRRPPISRMARSALSAGSAMSFPAR